MKAIGKMITLQARVKRSMRTWSSMRVSGESIKLMGMEHSLHLMANNTLESGLMT